MPGWLSSRAENRTKATACQLPAAAAQALTCNLHQVLAELHSPVALSILHLHHTVVAGLISCHVGAHNGLQAVLGAAASTTVHTHSRVFSFSSRDERRRSQYMAVHARRCMVQYSNHGIMAHCRPVFARWCPPCIGCYKPSCIIWCRPGHINRRFRRFRHRATAT